jgi:hypothetical protein
MLIKRTKYHRDISAAYTKGLEQGYELTRKLKLASEGKRQELSFSLDMHQSEESSLLLKQLVDIAEHKRIKLR